MGLYIFHWRDGTTSQIYAMSERDALESEGRDASEVDHWEYCSGEDDCDYCHRD